MYRIKYRRAIVKVPVNPRMGACQVCGRKGKTDRHHYKYAYETREVKRKPELALENTLELCFRCHRVANAVMLINREPVYTNIVRRLMG